MEMVLLALEVRTAQDARDAHPWSHGAGSPFHQRDPRGTQHSAALFSRMESASYLSATLTYLSADLKTGVPDSSSASLSQTLTQDHGAHPKTMPFDGQLQAARPRRMPFAFWVGALHLCVRCCSFLHLHFARTADQ